MRILPYTLVLLVASASAVHAGWPWGPLAGAPVCTVPGSQSGARVRADDEGGAFVAWTDKRSTSAIYAQHLAGDGTRLWNVDGVLLAQPGSDQLSEPQVRKVVRDGTGGAIVAWSRGSSLLAVQRVNGAGTPLWPPGGVVLCTANLPSAGEAMVSDGAGGLFAAWVTAVSSWSGEGQVITQCELHAQFVATDGSLAWGPTGMLVDSGDDLGFDVVAAADGQGGVVLAWAHHADLRAQRFTSAGASVWGQSVVFHGYAGSIAIAPTGDGGAFLTWDWMDTGSVGKLSAQRLDAAGGPMWGEPAPAYTLHQPYGWNFSPAVTATPAGDFVLGWHQPDTTQVLAAKRLTANGDREWQPLGVRVCSGVGPVNYGGYTSPVRTASDGSGGAYYAFTPAPADTGPVHEVRAARVNDFGAPAWPATGVLVASSPGGRYEPDLDALAGGDAIVVYTGGGVFAQRLHPDGTLGDFPLDAAPAALSGARLAAAPNPSSGPLRFTLSLPEPSAATLDILDAQGRRVARVLEARLDSGLHEVTWDGRDESGRPVPAGLYFARLAAPGTQLTRRVVLMR